MTPTALLPLLLASALACAAAQQAFVFACNRETAQAGWFALACAAAAAAAFDAALADPATSTAGRLLAAAIFGSWIAFSALFAADGSVLSADRWLARGAAGLAGGALILDIAAGSMTSGAATALRWIALGTLAWLTVRGTRRVLRSPDALHAGVLVCIGVAACLAGLGLPPATTQPTLPPAALVAVVLAAVLMGWQLARAIASERAMALRQRGELAHASRLAVVGELTATVAHEINQPLGAILSNADAAELLLEREAPPLDDIRHILADIRRDGLRASGVILHVRKLVRKRELEIETIEADALARAAVELLEHEARRRRLVLEHAPAAQRALVVADRALVSQVLINLLMNALDAAEAAEASRWHAEGGHTTIRLVVAVTGPRDVEFRVVDAGIGIPAERLERLFDSFYTSKDHGMGLGLSIARSIVEAHGGRIHASNNPTGGATFRFTLPLAATATTNAAT